MLVLSFTDLFTTLMEVVSEVVTGETGSAQNKHRSFTKPGAQPCWVLKVYCHHFWLQTPPHQKPVMEGPRGRDSLTSLLSLPWLPCLSLVVPNTEGEYRVGDLVLSGHILDNMTLVGRSQGSAKVLPCTGPAVMLDTSHPTEEKPTLCHKGQRLKKKWFKQ